MTGTAKSLGTWARVPLSENALQEIMMGGVKVDKPLQLKTGDQKPETTVFVSSFLLHDLGKLLRDALQFLLLPMGMTSGHGAHEALCIPYPAVCLSQWVPVLLSLFDIRVGSLPTSVLGSKASPENGAVRGTDHPWPHLHPQREACRFQIFS